MDDGRVLLVAEDTDGNWGLSVQDPADGTSASIRPFEESIESLPAPDLVRLADGRILIPQGAEAADPDGVSMSIFDPAGDELITAGSIAALGGSRVTPLADGGALVTGGDDPYGTYTGARSTWPSACAEGGSAGPRGRSRSGAAPRAAPRAAHCPPRAGMCAAPRPARGAQGAEPTPYMASNVSQTSTEAPPASTGQPFASSTAASRSLALMML